MDLAFRKCRMIEWEAAYMVLEFIGEGERELDQESNRRRCRVTDEIVNGGYFIALFGVTIFCFFASRVGGMSSRVT